MLSLYHVVLVAILPLMMNPASGPDAEFPEGMKLMPLLKEMVAAATWLLLKELLVIVSVPDELALMPYPFVPSKLLL